MLTERRFLGDAVPIGAAGGRRLVVNKAFPIDQNQLRHHHAVRRADAEERHHLRPGQIANRKANLEIADEFAYQRVCFSGLLHIVESVDGEINHLQAALAHFQLIFGELMGGCLAMGTSGENKFESNHFASILA